MAFSLKKILKGILIRQEGTLTPKEIEIIPGGSVSTKTTITTSQTTNKTITIPDATDTLVGKATTDVLTNKSIDADTNTITNIENADIKSGAAIDASKIANGSVSNSEFQQLDGLTTPAVGTTQSQTLTTKTIVVANNTITTAASGNLVATELNSALAELQGDIDTRATSANLALKANQTLDNLTTTAINADLLPATTLTRAIGSATLVFNNLFTNKIQSQTGEQIDVSNKTLKFDGTSILSWFNNGIQLAATRLLRFTSDDGLNTIGIRAPATATSVNYTLPTSTPAVNNQVLAATTGGVMSWVTASGAGGVNFISNGTGEDAVASIFVPYADAAGTRPVDGTGGSPTVTTSINSTNPLSGTKDYKLVKPASNTQGQGWAIPFSVDFDYRTKSNKITASYIVESGTFVAGSPTTDSDVIVYLYDVTNSMLLEPSNIKLLANSTTISDKYEASFQTNFVANGTASNYRLIFHCATTSALAYTLRVDNISVGPQTYVYGTPVTDWQSYTPTTQALGTISLPEVYYRRLGDSIEVKAKFTVGTLTAAEVRFGLPPGFTSADTSKIPSIQRVGEWVQDSGGANGGQMLIEPSVSYMTFSAQNGSQNGLAKFTTALGSFNAGKINLTATIPIQGLSSSIQMSDGYDGRVVAATVSKSTGAQTIAGGVNTKITFDTVNFDKIGMWDSANNRFIIRTAGDYFVDGVIATTTPAVTYEYDARILVNGATAKLAGFNKLSAVSGFAYAPFNFTLEDLKVGDFVELFQTQASGTTVTTRGNNIAPDITCFNIKKMPGVATISASETIATQASITSGQSLPHNTVTTLSWNNIINTTHGSLVGTTFTALTAGLFEFSLQVGVAGSSTGLQYTLQASTSSNGDNRNIEVVGTTPALFAGQPSVVLSPQQYRMVSGQTLTCSLYHFNNTSTNLTIRSGFTFLSIKKIGL